MEKSLRHGVALLYSMSTCTHVCARVAFGQSHHCLLGKPSIAHQLCSTLCYSTTHFISLENRHASYPVCRKYRHCSCYCKSTNGIITLSLYILQPISAAGFAVRLVVHCSQVVLRDEPEAKCKEFLVQHVEPFGRSLSALVCAACNFTKDFHPRLTLESGRVLRRVAGRKRKFIAFPIQQKNRPHCASLKRRKFLLENPM